MAYDPCNPTAGIPAAPGGAHHHHHFHRIVGRIKPRPHPITPVRIRAPIDPNGCAKAPPGGALNTPRPGIGGAGLGAGKLAALGGIGGAAAIGGGVLGGGGGGGSTGPGGGGGGGFIGGGGGGTGHGGGGGGGTTCTPPAVLGSDGKCTTDGGGGTPPTPVPEPATIAVFVMALGALCLARFMANRRPEASRARA